MTNKLFGVGQAIVLGVFGLCAAEPDAPVGTKETNIKVVEERTVTETRKVVETQVQQPIPAKLRKTAIFVNNTAGRQLNSRVTFFEDQVASKVSSKDFIVISREDVARALKVYPVDGPAPSGVQKTVQETAVSKREPGMAVDSRSVQSKTEVVSPPREDQNYSRDRNTLGTTADRMLSDNSSTLRLAQNIGAELILVATIGGYNIDTADFTDPQGKNYERTTHTLTCSYKVLEGVTGGALGGETFDCPKSFITKVGERKTDPTDALLTQAAKKIADNFATKAESWTPPAGAGGLVDVTISCGVRDLEGSEISLPNVTVNENNEAIKSGNLVRVVASAMVEIDGIAMGTTPATIKISPGMHKLRVTREGCKPYEGTIVAQPGLTIAPTLQLSDEGFQRWKDIRNFLSGLDRRNKLTDAQVKVLEGYAQQLRQSGYKVDVKKDITVDKKENINVNTTEGIKYEMYKSLY